MKKKVKSKCVAESKTIDLDSIKAIAYTAGMTASELLEWGMYCVFETFDGKSNQIDEVKKELETCRKLAGEIPKHLLPSDPLSEFAAAAGLNSGELTELALLEAICILDSSTFPNKQPREQLEDYHREQGPLIPSFLHDRHKAHPFMARLFCSDLKAVHGPTFGDPGSDHISGEHLFLEGVLERSIGTTNWGESICELMNIECVIRHCPELQNEAAAIRALIEAEKVLCDFRHAVNAA